MNLLWFNSLFYCKGCSFAFSVSKENEKERNPRLTFYLPCLANKTSINPFHVVKKLIWAAVFDRLFSDGFVVFLSCWRNQDISSHQSSCGCIRTRGDRRGRALTLYHPPQNAIKWEETGSPSPLLLRSPSLLEVGDGLVKVTPAGTVSF